MIQLFRLAIQLLLPVVCGSWDEYRQWAGWYDVDDEEAGMSEAALKTGRER